VLRLGHELRLAATDLANFLACRHRTALEMLEADGGPKRPFVDDPLLKLLRERGMAHEKAYVDLLRAQGLTVIDLVEEQGPNHAAATKRAMRQGIDVIVQGALNDGQWHGRPDILRRIPGKSAFGDWSYEVYDTKLARETRAGTILQLGLYSDMLRVTQQATPERFYVVTPDTTHGYRVADYAAYFRLIRGQLELTTSESADDVAEANYPEPVDHCDVCPWTSNCRSQRIRDDHLSLVAGVSRLQRRELESRDLSTLTSVAELSDPLGFKPKRGSIETYERVRDQARVQLASRLRTIPVHELRDVVAGQGLSRLPEPSPGDVFLDLEGDAFVGERGREYLFGAVILRPPASPLVILRERSEQEDLLFDGDQKQILQGASRPEDDRGCHYQAYWAFTAAEEKKAFEDVMDLIVARWRQDPTMHVYHYNHYEPTAFKRLMGRYATRGKELDELLRAERFVDLYQVVKQAMYVGVERYSIKSLEPLYQFHRAVPLPDANRALRALEHALYMNAPDVASAAVRAAVEGYNKDDCVSTLRLRDWLEEIRRGVIERGAEIPRPAPEAGEASHEVSERDARVAALRARLTADIPDDAAQRTTEQQARWILAYLLDWHRREDKVSWWEYFQLCALPQEDLFDEPKAVAGLEFVERVGVVKRKKGGKPTGSVIDCYRYPEQEMEIEPGDELKLQDKTKLGEVEAVDRTARTIHIRKSAKQADIHPSAAFAHKHISSKAQEDAICEIAERVAKDGFIDVSAGRPDRVARDLLLANPPRLRSGTFTCEAPEADYAVRIAGELDETVLAIQGPPGAGKTYCGARMIAALVAQGKRVGVVATSHKVIRNLLDEVHEADPSIRIGHKDEDDGVPAVGAIAEFRKNEEASDALASGAVQVLGGTSWLWARDDFTSSVDVLFVDEAGQMSLANVVAVSRAARSLVLLGDPRQLEQPQKGSHPDGVDVAALQHILGSAQTIPPEQGIFLPVTWRLSPSVCAFTSELFYEGKLRSRPGLENQRLSGTNGFDGSGLWVVDTLHEGNRNYAGEEIAIVASLVDRLTVPGARWTDMHGRSHTLTGGNILVVAPYNAHVTRLTAALDGTGVRVGTVDKFQGQEAPVVIYSMATSRPEDAPRGMEFLYSVNRLNVATSRARCAAILVASRRLFAPECRTPRQMMLANAMCRYRELAVR
jgi:uncharacterized protein